MKNSNWRTSAPQRTPLLQLLLALSLSACANSQQVPAPLPELPKPPALSTPLPQQTYSTSVQALLSRWAKRLTATSTTSEPSPGAGPSGTSSPTK